jgi:hypothetical protein
MAFDIDAKELAKVSYLRAEALAGRQVSLPALWDGTGWHSWVPQQDRTLLPVRPVELGEGTYLAMEAARPDDIHLPFADFVWKRASWPEVGHWYRAIIEDLHQLAASIAKVDFFWKTRDQVPGGALGVRRFVSSELEYLLMVCRSVLDELQEVVRALWGRVTLIDPDQQRRKKTLRGSFGDMVIHEGAVMTVEEIARRRHVPEGLAAAYASAGGFLKLLRDLRDGVVHHGKDAPVVLTSPRGFVIMKREPGFSSLPIWTAAHDYNQSAVSLRPALAYVVTTTLYTCNTFAEVLGRLFMFPESLAPEHLLFIRSVNGSALIEVQNVLRGGSAWWDGSH